MVDDVKKSNYIVHKISRLRLSFIAANGGGGNVRESSQKSHITAHNEQIFEFSLSRSARDSSAPQKF